MRGIYRQDLRDLRNSEADLRCRVLQAAGGLQLPAGERGNWSPGRPLRTTDRKFVSARHRNQHSRRVRYPRVAERPNPQLPLPVMKNFWLVKQEPDSYSWSDFVAEKRTSWTGVRNYTARNNLRSMQKDDEVFFYHSGEEK